MMSGQENAARVQSAAAARKPTYRDAYIAMYELAVPEGPTGSTRRLQSPDVVGLVAAALHIEREEAIPLVRVACEGKRRLVTQIRGLSDLRFLQHPELVRRMREEPPETPSAPRPIPLRAAWRFLRRERAIEAASGQFVGEWVVRDPVVTLLGKFRSGNSDELPGVKLTVELLAQGGHLELFEEKGMPWGRLLNEPEERVQAAVENQPQPTAEDSAVKEKEDMAAKKTTASERRRVVFLRPWEGDLYDEIVSQIGQAADARPWIVEDSPLITLRADNPGALAGPKARADALGRFVRAGILIPTGNKGAYQLAIAPRSIKTVMIDERPVLHARAKQEKEVRKIQAEFDPSEFAFGSWFDEKVVRGGSSLGHLQYVGFKPEEGIGKSLGIVVRDETHGGYAVSCDGLEGYDFVFEDIKRNRLEQERIPEDAKFPTWKKAGKAVEVKRRETPPAVEKPAAERLAAPVAGAPSMRQRLELAIAEKEQKLVAGRARLQELEREREEIVRQQAPLEADVSNLREALKKMEALEEEMRRLLGGLVL